MFKNSINFMGNRHIALWFSGILSLISVASLAVNGLHLGIDFTGGTLVEVGYKQAADLNVLRDKLQDTLAGATSLADAADRLATEEDVFFSMRFLLQRPLLKAILSEEPTVLLIDEIDRADAEFEAFLLEVLSDFQVSVPELGTLVAKHRPIVLLTSNNTRELSEALKRRCLYLFIGYPDREQELAVVRLKVPDLSSKLAGQAVDLVQKLRSMDLRKLPSISETLDWAKALVKLNSKALDTATLESTMGVLLKHETDLQKVKRRMQVTNKGVEMEDDDLRSYRNVGRG